MNLDHIPSYGRRDAEIAIDQIRDLERNAYFRPGLYYIVLVDLCGSTKASAEIGADANTARIQSFVGATIQAWRDIQPRSLVQFVKAIGDASLFIFSNFQDILDWHDELLVRQASLNSKVARSKLPDVHLFYSKTVIHAGEVLFNADGDALALAINQIFKIEKLFSKDEIGFTDIVAQVVRPRIESKEFAVFEVSNVELPGETKKQSIWKINRA
jgi:class 3 adenylate cyclase